MSTLSLVILATILVSLISVLAALILLRKKDWEEGISHKFVAFAAGTMLAAAVLDLMPEAIEQSSNIPDLMLFFLAGIVLFFFLERFILWFHHHDSMHHSNPSTILVLVGDGIHNFIDGLVIAASFMASPAIGFITTFTIAAHEIPQELGDFSILLSGGMKKYRALLANFLSALAAVVGGIVGFFFLEAVQAFVPYMLMFTAGMFIYIACSDLIPELHKDSQKRGWKEVVPFLLGMIVLGVMIRTLGH